jgi:CheY-like chemotaxis protein
MGRDDALICSSNHAPSFPLTEPAHLLAGLRIVVVDDHEDSRDLLQQAFAFLGAEVTVAVTAEEAMQSIANADVVVTDCELVAGRLGRAGHLLIEIVLERLRLPDRDGRLERTVVVVVAGFQATAATRRMSNRDGLISASQHAS